MRIQGPSGQAPQPPEPQKYITELGDTLRSVSAKLNVDSENLGKINNLRTPIDDPLDVGRELIIPAKVIPERTKGLTKDDLLEVVKDRFNPFDSTLVQEGDTPGPGGYWSEEEGPPPWVDTDWGEMANWTEIDPDVSSRSLLGEPGSESPLGSGPALPGPIKPGDPPEGDPSKE